MADIDEAIARVRELSEAATPGPWTPSVGVYQDMDGDSEADDCFFGRGPVPFPHARALGEADAALIAYYRTAAPQLADECERLRDENADLRDRLRLFAADLVCQYCGCAPIALLYDAARTCEDCLESSFALSDRGEVAAACVSVGLRAICGRRILEGC